MIVEQNAFRSQPVAVPIAQDVRCFTIVCEGHTYGLPVECIQTVFEMMAVTPVPLASPEILGLVNLRGKIVTAVSLRRRLRRDGRLAEPSNLAIGLEHRGESFALIVDEVGDVLTLDPAAEIDQPPHLGDEGAKIESVYRLDDIILPVLDLDWVLSFRTDERDTEASLKETCGHKR